MTYLLTKPAFLVITAALAYAIATAGIKWASDAPSPMALFLIILGFGLATIAEVIVLRQADLGVIYIAIITVETLMVLTLAALIGEGAERQTVTGRGLCSDGHFHRRRMIERQTSSTSTTPPIALIAPLIWGLTG